MPDNVQETKKLLQDLKQLKIVKIYENKKRLFYYNFIAGIARGLGTVLGATIVLALVIFTLTRLQWIPLFGDFISQLLEYLESTRSVNFR